MLTNLKSLPDPTKSVWEQDVRTIEILMYVDKIVNAGEKRVE